MFGGLFEDVSEAGVQHLLISATIQVNLMSRQFFFFSISVHSGHLSLCVSFAFLVLDKKWSGRHGKLKFIGFSFQIQFIISVLQYSHQNYHVDLTLIRLICTYLLRMEMR